MKEKCPRCRSEEFSIVRDMTSRRTCSKCGLTWEPQKNVMTDWEVGQEMIAISDFMWARIEDFKLSHPEVFEMIQDMRLKIGDKFNRMGTHEFGLASHESYPPKDLP